MELQCIQALEPGDDLRLILRKQKTCQEGDCGIDPPFSIKPEHLLLAPPGHLRTGQPPVFRAVPPCEMTIVTEADAHSDNDDSDDKHADMMILDEPEGKEKR